MYPKPAETAQDPGPPLLTYHPTLKRPPFKAPSSFAVSIKLPMLSLAKNHDFIHYNVLQLFTSCAGLRCAASPGVSSRGRQIHPLRFLPLPGHPCHSASHPWRLKNSETSVSLGSKNAPRRETSGRCFRAAAPSRSRDTNSQRLLQTLGAHGVSAHIFAADEFMVKVKNARRASTFPQTVASCLVFQRRRE